MTKADLIEEVSRVVEMTRKDSEVIVEAIFDSIVRALRGADKIEIPRFGSFVRDSVRREWAVPEDRYARGSAGQEDPLFQTEQRVKGRGERRGQGTEVEARNPADAPTL